MYVFKFDLEKAYDKMSWPFIEESLKDADLPNKMIYAIMGIIRDIKCQLLWNGEITELIKPIRGQRQDDPLSPLIFVLCLERLSHWI